MSDETEERAVALAMHIIETACTVRAAAAKFGMGKSTVHKYVTEILKEIDNGLYERVRHILDYNMSVRHLRGGEATRRKCLAHRKNS